MACENCDSTGLVEVICYACKGSGEGNYDGSTCWSCKGSGSAIGECTECEEEDE